MKRQATQAILNALTAQFGDIKGLRSITATDADKFVITVANPKAVRIPARLTLTIGKKRTAKRTVRVVVHEGPEIISFGSVIRFADCQLPIPPVLPGPVLGGEAIWHVALGAWGTLALTATRIRIQNDAGAVCDIRNACLSNNHILALSDGAAVGDSIQCPGRPAFAGLRCWLPISNTPKPVDAALGEMANPADASLGVVRGIGRVNGVRSPRRNLQIQKSSRRTGVTFGKDLGATNIVVGGTVYRGMRVASSGLSCCHDSGAAILDMTRRFVGLLFAGDAVSCANGPVSYYIPALPWTAAPDPGIDALRISIQV